ncbi:MAG: hypothetical protein ACM3MD_09485 [Betaproteobacteria bacterium]
MGAPIYLIGGKTGQQIIKLMEENLWPHGFQGKDSPELRGSNQRGADPLWGALYGRRKMVRILLGVPLFSNEIHIGSGNVEGPTRNGHRDR